MPPKQSVLPSTGCKVMVCVFIQSEFSWTIMTLFVRVCSNDAEFLWRLARASRDLSLLPNIEAGRKKQLTFEAFEYAKKALEKDDLCSAAHKVRLWFLRGQLDTHRMLITSFNRFLFFFVRSSHSGTACVSATSGIMRVSRLKLEIRTSSGII